MMIRPTPPTYVWGRLSAVPSEASKTKDGRDDNVTGKLALVEVNVRQREQSKGGASIIPLAIPCHW
jgi:hypothetical protein